MKLLHEKSFSSEIRSIVDMNKYSRMVSFICFPTYYNKERMPSPQNLKIMSSTDIHIFKLPACSIFKNVHFISFSFLVF